MKLCSLVDLEKIDPMLVKCSVAAKQTRETSASRKDSFVLVYDRLSRNCFGGRFEFWWQF